MCLTAFKAVMEFGGEGGEDDEWNNNERKMIRRPAPTEADKWNTLPEVPNKAAMGYLHLSFEYHRGALKVRVWQISDLLLPPPQISMIYSIFVRGYFIPDTAKKTNRRTEDVLVDLTDLSGNERVKSGIQHIFTPSSFKFRNPLLYTAVTADIIRERSLQLEVCMTQKQSHRTFLMAMVHMPLRVAVRRPIREKYPLIPCMNVTIPNNMRVYSAAELQLESSKGRGLNNVSKGDNIDSAIPLSARTPREMELEDVVSLSGEDFLRSHLSLCLDEDSDDENSARRGGLRAVVVTNGVRSGGSSSTTLNMPSSGDEEDADNEDDDIPHIVTNGLRVRKSSDKAARKQSGQSETSSIEMNNESTTIDMNHVSGGSTSRKKIIPDALTLQDVSFDVTLDMPAEETVVDMDISSSSDSQQDLSASSPEPVSPETKHAHEQPLRAGLLSGDTGEPVSPENKPARKKIIPAELDRLALNSSSDQENETLERADETDSGISEKALPSVEISTAEEDPVLQEQHAPETVPKKKKITVLSTTIVSASKRSHRSTDSARESIPKPSRSSTDSDGLSPYHLTDVSDSPFTPASRPETPCWDFYDFDEQLQQEDDPEALNMTLDQSLARLQHLGLGSAHNLSMEPILPMDLVDDFDSFAAESEQNADAEQAS